VFPPPTLPYQVPPYQPYPSPRQSIVLVVIFPSKNYRSEIFCSPVRNFMPHESWTQSHTVLFSVLRTISGAAAGVIGPHRKVIGSNLAVDTRGPSKSSGRSRFGIPWSRAHVCVWKDRRCYGRLNLLGSRWLIVICLIRNTFLSQRLLTMRLLYL